MPTPTLLAAGLVAGSAFLTGYLCGALASAPTMVDIGHVGCRGQARVSSFAIPLEALSLHAPGVPLRFGPIRLSMDGPEVALEFETVARARTPTYSEAERVLRLPRSEPMPRQITLRCHNGTVAAVDYGLGSHAILGFQVTMVEVQSADHQVAP